MIESSTDLLIGIPGTVLYLYLWNRVIGASQRAGELSEAEIATRKWRRRSWQVLFFLAMTPYVLFLFWLMERVRSLLELSADLPDQAQ